MARRELAAVMTPGTHASTFGGNPIACAAGLATLRVFDEDKLVERSALLGQRTLAALREELRGCPTVSEVRGRGCLIGIELAAPSDVVVDLLRARGILVSIVRKNVMRLAPPFTIPLDVLDQGVQTIVDVLKDPMLARHERMQTLRSPEWHV